MMRGNAKSRSGYFNNMKIHRTTNVYVDCKRNHLDSVY